MCFASIISLWIYSSIHQDYFTETNVKNELQESFTAKENQISNTLDQAKSNLQEYIISPIDDSSNLLLLYKNGKLIRSNTDKLTFNDINSLYNNKNKVTNFNNIYYYIAQHIEIDTDTLSYYILTPILNTTSNDEKIYLSEMLDRNILAQQLSIREINNKENSTNAIIDKDGNKVFSFDILSDNYVKSTQIHLILVITFSISFILSIHFISLLWIKFHKVSGLLIEVTFFLVGYFIHKNLSVYINPINDNILFSTSFLSSNEYFNNLYQLFYILFTVGLFCSTILKIFTKKEQLNLAKYNVLIQWIVYIIIATGISLFIYQLNLQVLQTVVFDSKISLVTDNLQYINFTTVVGTCIIIYCAIISIFLIYIIRLVGETCNFTRFQHLTSFIIIEIVLCYYISKFAISFVLYQGFFTKILIYLLITIIPPPTNNVSQKNNLNWQIWFMIISIYGVSAITILNNAKETEFRSHYAANNFKKQSIKFEYQFEELINEIKRDSVINKQINKDEINVGNYILNNYFEKLNTELIIDATPLKELKPNQIVDSLIYSDQFAEKASYYYILKRTSDYLKISIEIKDLFYFKKNKIESLVFNNTNSSDYQFLAKYATAKYENNKLTMYDGIEEYPPKIPTNVLKNTNEDGEYWSNNFTYSLLYKFSEDRNQCVLIVYKRNIVMQIITTLSTILLLLISSVSIYYGYKKIIIQKKFKKLNFTHIHLNMSAKINIAFITTIIVSFFIVGIMVVNIISSNNKSNYENKNLKNLSIAKVFINEIDQNINANISSLAEKFNIIALIYDTTGVLQGNKEHISANEYLNSKYILTPQKIELLNNSNQNYISYQGGNTFYNYKNTIGKINIDGKNLIVKIFDYDATSATGESTSDIILGIINILILVIFIASIITFFIVKTSTKPIKIITQKFKDISLKHNEPIIWPYADEFQPLVNEYNNMIQKVENLAQKLSVQERENLWREVAQQVAHEIKNPLTPIRLNIQYLERAIADKRDNIEQLTSKVCTVILEQIDTLNRIASEFSTLAKIDTQDPEVIHLHELITNLEQLFISTESVHVSYETTHYDVKVFMDKSYIIRSITNILKNAIQAIPEDREKVINITTTKLVNQVTITITDNGNGIPPEIEEKLFTPYFTSKSNGTGIGLNMTKKMIEVSGGSITYRTEQNVGTSFIITLPIHTGE